MKNKHPDAEALLNSMSISANKTVVMDQKEIREYLKLSDITQILKLKESQDEYSRIKEDLINQLPEDARDETAFAILIERTARIYVLLDLLDRQMLDGTRLDLDKLESTSYVKISNILKQHVELLLNLKFAFRGAKGTRTLDKLSKEIFDYESKAHRD